MIFINHQFFIISRMLTLTTEQYNNNHGRESPQLLLTSCSICSMNKRLEKWPAEGWGQIKTARRVQNQWSKQDPNSSLPTKPIHLYSTLVSGLASAFSLTKRQNDHHQLCQSNPNKIKRMPTQTGERVWNYSAGISGWDMATHCKKMKYQIKVYYGQNKKGFSPDYAKEETQWWRSWFSENNSGRTLD